MRVLVTRPEPAASRTAARLRELGHEAIVAPLLIPRPLDWAVPPGKWQAVAFTSASAAALAGDLSALALLPAYAVGEATAAAARDAGFTQVRSARGDASAVFALAAADGIARLLHLAGQDRSAATVPPGLTVGVVTVYVAELAGRLDVPQFDLALLYSARTAAQFDTLFAGDRSGIVVAALSPAVAAAASPGWGRVAVAAEPTEAALFAAAGLTCDNLGQDG